MNRSFLDRWEWVWGCGLRMCCSVLPTPGFPQQRSWDCISVVSLHFFIAKTLSSVFFRCKIQRRKKRLPWSECLKHTSLLNKKLMRKKDGNGNRPHYLHHQSIHRYWTVNCFIQKMLNAAKLAHSALILEGDDADVGFGCVTLLIPQPNSLTNVLKIAFL